MWSITDCQAALQRYLPCVFEEGDIVEVRCVFLERNKRKSRSTWHKANKLLEVASELLGCNAKGENIYVGANPRKADGGTKAADVALARCVFCDWDGGVDIAGASGRWESAGLPEPTVTLHSGHGIHAYWRLMEPLANLAEWTRLQVALIQAVDSDPRPKDPPRVMRLPGFDNRKAEPVPCVIIDADRARRYCLDDLGAILCLNAEKAHSSSAFTQQTQQTQAFSADARKPTQTKAILARSPWLQDDSVQQAILETVPTGPGQSNRCVWRLARKLKAIPAVKDAEALALEPIFDSWWSFAKSKVSGNDDYYLKCAEFADAWNNVNFPEGTNVVAVACELASKAPLPKCVACIPEGRIRLLAAICRALQSMRGDGVFYLSCRDAGEAIGVSHTQAAGWLRFLEVKSIIRTVKKYEHPAARATEYQYIGD